MPIKIPAKLPAADTLTNENIFFITEERASHQDIRPLRIVILNLMPTKVATETQLVRLLGNSPLQIEIDLLQTETYTSKNTSEEHLTAFYSTFDQIKHLKYDGMIITGAPVELMPFEEVDYWEELKTIMDWSLHHVTSTMHICWGAQAGLYHHFSVQKSTLDTKMFGVFAHTLNDTCNPLLRGFDDVFYVPHSRHTTVTKDEISKVDFLEILSESDESGVYIVISKDGRQVFVTGHSEYDKYTLHGEYMRDVNKGLDILVPQHYYPGDDPSKPPYVRWRSHSNLLFINWLNYYVYQITPYNLDEIS
ncbi:MAG: homoserine O-succinyltransferase [Hyphomonadaceae bacterium]|nr:homoserine O-succinyltransferase [Clostridia bacterium]